MKKTKGFALISVLVVAIVLALGSVTMLQVMQSYGQQKYLSVQSVKAQYAAEAGKELAIYDLSQDPQVTTNYTGANAKNIGGYTVEVVKTAPASAGDPWTIESTATYNA